MSLLGMKGPGGGGIGRVYSTKPGLLAAWLHQFITGLGDSWEWQGHAEEGEGGAGAILSSQDLTYHVVGAEAGWGWGGMEGMSVHSLLPTPMLNRMATPKRNLTVGLWKPSFSP